MSCNVSLASGYLSVDHCPECKINSVSSSVCVFVCLDLAEQRLCQGHVAGGGKPSPASRGVCGSDHTGQRTPAVAPTGRYRRVWWGGGIRCQRTPAVSQTEGKTCVCVCDRSLTLLLSLLSTCLQVWRSPCQSASWMSSPWTFSPLVGARPTLTL